MRRAIALLLLPPAVSVVVHLAPGWNPLLEVPLQHLLVVTLVAVVAMVLAVILAVAAVGIRNYRALLLALAFVAMAGLFAVHGLATPGVLLSSAETYSYGGVIGVSAFLSVALPAVLIAVAYTPAARLERRVDVGPLRAAVAGVVLLVAVYASVALFLSRVLEDAPFAVPPLSYAFAAVSVLLLAYAAARQLVVWQDSRRPMQGALVVVFGLLAEAQLIMVTSPAWTAGWWIYHFVLLVAVSLALRALAVERAYGRGVRDTVEAALALEVQVNAEIESVERIAALATAIELYDRELKGHNVRVAELSVEVGRALRLDSDRLRVLARAALLHDVGKLDIPADILHKRGPLDPTEWQVMRTHPDLGVRIMQKAGRLRRESEAVRAHHERMDGSGYPRGLRGDAIPIEARIIAVVDTFDVLLSDRPYRERRPLAEALRVIEAERGAHLDDAVVDALLRIIAEQRVRVPQIA